MKTTDPISVPGLSRDAGDPKINEFITGLIRKYHAPVIELLDEPDEEGNCQIRVTSGDPDVLYSMQAEIELRTTPGGNGNE